MYSPSSELQKWGKKTAETRRRNCAVLPYEKHRRFSAAVFLRLVEAVKGQTGYVLAEFPDGIRQAALDLGHVMDVGAFDELALHRGQILELAPHVRAEGVGAFRCRTRRRQWNSCRDPDRYAPR